MYLPGLVPGARFSTFKFKILQTSKPGMLSAAASRGEADETPLQQAIIGRKAKKIEIKEEMEKMFKVKVQKVNTTIQKGKKKAYVRLSPETPAIDIATQLGMM